MKFGTNLVFKFLAEGMTPAKAERALINVFKAQKFVFKKR